MEKFKCNVSGIQNNVEKTQLKNALIKIDGVKDIGVNLATGEVIIGYKEPATINDIQNCIQNSGFKIE